MCRNRVTITNQKMKKVFKNLFRKENNANRFFRSRKVSVKDFISFNGENTIKLIHSLKKLI